VLWHCWLGGRKGIRPIKYMGNGGGGHCLVRMEWRPAGWSVCLPLLIFPCTIKFRSSLLAPAYPGGPGKRAVKQLWWWRNILPLTYVWLGLATVKLWDNQLNAIHSTAPKSKSKQKITSLAKINQKTTKLRQHDDISTAIAINIHCTSNTSMFAHEYLQTLD